jgi:hypothetical protein
MTGGASLPATLAMDYLGRPIARTALDAKIGSKARLVPGAEGELAVRPGGDLVGGATNRGRGLTTPAAAIDTATGAISPMDAAAIRKQRFDQENAAKLAQVQQEQARRMSEVGARRATPEEMVESNPMIMAVKQRAQAQLPSTPKDLAIDAVTGTSNPAVTAVAAQDKAKQMLAPEMRAQIEARVAAQKAAQQAKMQETMSAPAIPDQRSTYAPLPTLEDKLARLKQEPQAGQLFEGLPGEGTTGRTPSAAELKQLEMEAREAAGIEQPDMSDFGKVYSEAQIARKYQQYKDAKSPAAKARLKAEYDRMENARSDRGLNEGGVPGVLEMKIGESPTPMAELKGLGSREQPFANKEDYDKANLFNKTSGQEVEGWYKNGDKIIRHYNDVEMPHTQEVYKDKNGFTIEKEYWRDGDVQVTKSLDGMEISTRIIRKPSNKPVTPKADVIKMETGPVPPKAPPGVLEMKLSPAEEKHNVMNTLGLPDNVSSIERQAAQMSQALRDTVVRGLETALKQDPGNKDLTDLVAMYKKYEFTPEGPVVPKENTPELTMEAMRASGAKLIPGKDMTLDKVKKQMKIMSPNLKWEQVSPTHIRGRIGNMEYNVIDSNGDIYQTIRTIK